MRKYIFYPIIVVFTLSLASTAMCGGSGKIRAVRAGENDGVHRLVIELNHKAGYRIKRNKRTLEVDVHNVDSGGFRNGLAGTDFFRVRKLYTIKENGHPLTIFLMTLKGPAEIRGQTMESPYRIIVDMYPARAKKITAKRKKFKKPLIKKAGSKTFTAKKILEKKSASVTRASKKKTSKKTAAITRIAKKKTPLKIAAKKTIVRKKAVKKTAVRPYHGPPYRGAYAFNEGWRWIYRKAAVQSLRVSFYGNLRDHGLEMLSEFIPVKGGDAWADGMEAEAYIKGLSEEGDEAGAVTLKAIIDLLKKKADINDVESEIMKTPENTLTPLARFLLASAYEREGFYPEAIAYYGMAYEAKSIKRLKALSSLGGGRALFFSGRAATSLKWFERARQEGSHEALGWLAGSLLLKGDYPSAWADFKRLGTTKDPLSLMGLADIKMKRGDYSGAGLIFQGLETRFKREPFLASFFALREADSLLASGLVNEGLSAYSAIKKHSKGEALAMVNMALADYYSTDGKSPMKAKALYKDVARGTNSASGEALMRLSEVLEGLREHGEAMRTLEEILPENTLFTGRDSTGFLRSKIAYNWIKDLYAEKKWLELTMVNYQYGASVTFGKKAGTFLRAGEALMRLGLTPDAVKALNMAKRIGTKEVKVKALLLLTRLYLDQRDGRAAGNVLENLRVTSPKVARSTEWREYNLEAQYLKGNYREVIGLGGQGDRGNLLIMIAASYQRLAMWPEAIKTYSEAIALFKKNGDNRGLIKAETGYGDSQFASRGFIEAIDAYKRATGMAKTPVDTSWARYRLSLSYAEAGMRDKAMSTVRELKGRDKAYGEWAEAISLARE